MEELTDQKSLPSFYEDRYPLPWMMSTWEKHTFISLLNALKPQAAIEISNAKGGSLQVLNDLVAEVYAIDINPEVPRELQQQFSLVHFITGNSPDIVPVVLKKWEEQKISSAFILIDGDHSALGVQKDIDSILANYRGGYRLVILFHDSFNPECRKGILNASWQNCPYVQSVDVDYVPGTLVDDTYRGKIQRNTMWGGFCLAILEPAAKKEKVLIRSLQKKFMTRHSKDHITTH